MKKTPPGNNQPILFLDSGIGGLPYCKYFSERNKNEALVYLGDREHFPYGKRSREDLVFVLSGIVRQLVKKVNPKIAVLACNTATVCALDELRRIFPALPFVGTVPAVKPAVLAAKGGKVGVLGTERTIEEPYIRRLAAENGGCEITGIAAPELVDFVERRLMYADKAEKHAAARMWLDQFRAKGVNSIVLGCTHFLFLLEEFRAEALPDITVFDSMEGISRRIESLLDENNGVLRSASVPLSENTMLLTGNAVPEDSWNKRAQEFGFTLSLLEKP